MLTRIEIDGFKSFTNFSMEFSPLTIIAGLNASGKSNLFDALHLLSLLAEHDLNTAFDKVQRGSNLELFTQYADGRHAEEMRFAVEMLVEPAVEDGGNWAQLSSTSLRYELVLARQINKHFDFEELVVISEWLAPVGMPNDNHLREVEELLSSSETSEHPPFIKTESYHHRIARRMTGNKKQRTGFETMSATLISDVNSVLHFPHVVAVQKEMSSWKVVHLDPRKLLLATPRQFFAWPGPLNASADNLAGVLFRISKTEEYLLIRIAQRLASLVPGIKEFKVDNDDYSQRYRVWAITTAGQRFPLHLLSEGTLRMLALCTLVFDPEQAGVLGLEEPENGVHPARLAGIAELLRDLSHNEPAAEGAEPAPLRQVIVNTHSPGLVKACLAAVAEEGKAAGLTVWFSQLVSRSATEDGKRVMRRVTDMLPVLLPNVPSELSAETVAALDPSQKKFALHQLIRYLESTDPDHLLDQLDLVPPQPSAA
ncbi:MAG: AAA family ATPase [Hymenobacteraceae bacterium]|nr:AAA family ATPase [Hymenobacteraceae bacterium]